MAQRISFPHPDDRVLPDRILCQSPPQQTPSVKEDKVIGCLLGLAIGDALGASVEFRPHEYLVENPVIDLQGGGTWGLQAGQWTDDTSMALCLASSLLTQRRFNTYDQMVRYKWWYKKGFLSSTGQCFDIGSTTRASLEEFRQRQNILRQHFPHVREEQIDSLPLEEVRKVREFNEFCGLPGQAGNGPLMRLAPVPLFYHRQPEEAVHLAGESARVTHGDEKAVDACRYFAALIVAAVNGESKDQLLDEKFIEKHRPWFGSQRLHPEVVAVANGSFQRSGGYKDGIRGKNYIIQTLEAALWAFWSDGNNFETGVLNAVNLGDDADTTAAVYGQLAGAYYGLTAISSRWGRRLYAHKLLICIAEWLYFDGSQNQSNASSRQQRIAPPISLQTPKKPSGGIMGYDKQDPPKAISHKNPFPPDFNPHRPKENQRLDGSKLPPAGKRSGL
ncbi:unnamed protein product [Adineta ricciae]|uniref:Uncharacterized protein n=1 Tax=Adineta ricciae TaxID=249248 RepID=A0A815RH71_ADIRI|nr:unnamed protein product [Adineta ricciae]